MLFMSAFFYFDKDFHPVFIDYSQMSHADNIEAAIHHQHTL